MQHGRHVKPLLNSLTCDLKRSNLMSGYGGEVLNVNSRFKRLFSMPLSCTQIKFVYVNLFRIGLIKKRRPPGLKQIIFYSTFYLPTSHPNIVKFVIEMKNVQLE